VMGVISSPELAASTAPFADAASAMWGGWAMYAVAAGAAISCFGALNGWILLSGQMPMAMARDALFPRSFARLSSRGIPRMGLVVSSVPVFPPVITMDPQDVGISVGQDALFSVKAAGTTPLTYRWFFNTNTLIASGLDDIPVINGTDLLKIPCLVLEDNILLPRKIVLLVPAGHQLQLHDHLLNKLLFEVAQIPIIVGNIINQRRRYYLVGILERVPLIVRPTRQNVVDNDLFRGQLQLPRHKENLQNETGQRVPIPIKHHHGMRRGGDDWRMRQRQKSCG